MISSKIWPRKSLPPCRPHQLPIPPEIMAQMPKDGASQHDHYIYGWPKKEA
jgi:hypothetical protein